ncbi:4-coumarate--coa ligase 1-like [Plakobranchus ocellatus]|uniref:Luciferin 4-monooxygenase n=1 Tax=Plakobranchus ocellatus TaxID=259542 RepID=A0AAV4DXY9_9GAST|nr:4-coumarate--coa ligase 1-like [Plakobranchus ocellatus]
MACRIFRYQIRTCLQTQFLVSGQGPLSKSNSFAFRIFDNTLMCAPRNQLVCSLHSMTHLQRCVALGLSCVLPPSYSLGCSSVPSPRPPALLAIPTAPPTRWASKATTADYGQSPITSDNILRSPLPDIHIPDDIPWHQIVFDLCDKYKDKIAVEEFLTGRKYTYTQLKDASFRVASALCRKGYRKGDVILAFAVNNVDYSVLMVACAANGVWFSAANPNFTPAELARQLQNSGARGLCISAHLAGVAKEAMENREFPNNVMDLFTFDEASGFQPFQELLDDDGKAFPDVDLDVKKDVLFLPYSSGTTGFPKGVMLSHHNCVANMFQVSKVFSPDESDRCLGLLPMYHTFGMIVILSLSLYGGASIVYLPRFDPKLLLRCLQESKISIAFLVPPLFLFLAKHPRVSNFDLTSMKEVFCGAAPLGEELTAEFRKRHPYVEGMRQAYGLTETSPLINVDMTETPGASGHMLPNTWGKIVDTETHQPLGFGQRGELWVKGPQIMQGYYMNQKATDDMIASDGWLHTGDIGYFNDEGVVVIKDRLKELIKYKGSQVAPAELEAIILSHPGVQDVAVVGIPDEKAGELPKAFVVPKPESNLTEDQVESFVKDKVAHTNKLRGGVQFVDEIPKNPSGKILRRILRVKYM